MPKGMAQGREAKTTLVGLRDMIHDLEIQAGNLSGRGEGGLGVLRLRDQIETELAAYAQEGVDLRPERTRVETIDHVLARKTSVIARELRNQGGFMGARRAENPPEEHWWWYLDLYQAERQRKSLRKTVIIVAVALAVVIGGDQILNRLYGLSPAEKQARSLTSQAEQYLYAGDSAHALPELQKAATVMPTLGDTQVLLGVAYELQGDSEKAKDTLAGAEELFPNSAEYLMILARAYQGAGKLEAAMNAIQAVITADPQSAQGYLIRGGIYEQQLKNQEAYNDFERAGTLAQEQKQDVLYVLARTRMASVMQRGAGGGMMGGTGF